MAHVVALLAMDWMNPFEFAVACEVFGITRREVMDAAGIDEWYDLRVCAEVPGRTVPTRFGFDLQVPGGLDDLATADTVIVPMAPKRSDAETQPIFRREPLDTPTPVLEALAAAHDRGARMVSFCSGAFALAEAGILDGRRATTHWMYLETFRERFPRVDAEHDVLWVEDDGVFTSAGSAAGIDLSLHLVRLDHGADVADGVARRMVVPPHRDGGQAQYVAPAPTPPTAEHAMGQVMAWAIDNLDQHLSVEELAERAAQSPRTFARHFRRATGTTPHQWLTGQRVLRARSLLETTDLTVDQVAERSGLGTAANLRLRLDDAVGVTPTAYRSRFTRAS
ncbi:GlxA family transcriptional regulator [Salsipaludibacter albus]|uniref:GlxA family transcriptional regulator n=1 Tax=Salsipaludibacter albus TaxID=2849650 RepID=UPI001EE3CDFE|nr:helix-turn-helix domain-containing protein [Salsipaludibacter albus]MBY5161178.1 helix-turn-helix domain-containing protein [Salsipaludibacter albus]